jgi:hypothetical protein
MEQQTKLQNSSMVQELSKIASVPVVTPKKGRRMANILDVVLRPQKMVTLLPQRFSKARLMN